MQKIIRDKEAKKARAICDPIKSFKIKKKIKMQVWGSVAKTPHS